MRWPSLTTMPASTLVACSTSVRSAIAASPGDTQAGQHVDRSADRSDVVFADRSRFHGGGQLGQFRREGWSGERPARPNPNGEFEPASDLVRGDPQARPQRGSHQSYRTRLRLVGRRSRRRSDTSGPRLTRSWSSSRSAISTRTLLPSKSDGVPCSTSWAASIASRAAVIRSRACSAPIPGPILRGYESGPTTPP